MKFATVALSALAVSLATPAIADHHAAGTEAAASAYPMTPQGAADWVAMVEKDMFDFSVEYGRVLWLNNTYIVHDSDQLAAKYGAEATEKSVRYANEAAKYARVEGLDAEVARKLDILRNGIVMPAPVRDGAATELNEIATKLGSAYGKGKGTLNGEEINGSDIEAEMGNLDRTPAELAEMWASWHDNVGAPMRGDYQRMIAIANEGSKELGFADLGAMWRSNYDMDPDQFAAETERMWQEVKPLYMALHTYVRGKLNAKYGAEVQPATGPIRADLLGNMWAQEWGNIYPLVAPEGAGDIGYDLTDLITAKGLDEIEMVRTGEQFFSSLGFEPLPETFWERSQFVKPQDREVVCHASAWDVDNVDDLRIKMCIKKNADDFITIHHELGHNYYQRAYNQQDYLHLNGANDGFHEAIGDMIALSITPEYLVQIDMLDEADVPSADKDIGLLLRQAMDKVAFLPFGLMVDRYRWGLFDGSIPADQLNKGWNDLRLEYQGIVPPVERDESGFDAGAKYHIPGNVPYTRYFLARILQFQFFKAACDQAGWEGPLHRCSFYGNEEVGKNLNAMLEMGASKPWPDALEAFTGERQMSGAAMAEYFAPLKAWLDEQNAGMAEGW
ncbi:M2 family metallopeptidase [Qipengyuania flava]|jgi:peptidyl-dipeptidase A|uniref:M2 family metallopeptidase n=1 Tax=Qipengyuania flava TaxID=192812 RepID=UPI001C587B7A|nr:M2 family metallopeptidase [Qipengyuania flava]MBW3168624.1 M2 family metallopeptidase [Qipengyuania flava]MBY5965862.1 M2 family metallopeptidase [Qipengyuania flava]MBY6012186.1 M2 family metallopeptidase [Qipengyuania flava]MBY6026628.1 M2 family metallopeptidase [Qipengyuania flava]